MNSEEFRRVFPILERVTWFNTPSTAPAAKPVLERMRGELHDWCEIGLDWPEQDRTTLKAREGFAALVGMQASDVALVHSVAEATGTIANSLGSVEVVLGSQEYRSLLYPWLNQPGASVREVVMPHGYLASQAVVDAITRSTGVVAVSWVQSASGSRIDLGPIRRRCDEVGAKLLVDATQGLGVLDFSNESRADFIVAHGYKWLLAPRGAAWLAVAPEVSQELRPLAPSNKSAPGSWCNFYGGPFELKADASRLDASLSWPSWAGAQAALDLVRSLPTHEVEEHCLHLAAALRSNLQKMGLETARSEVPSHIVSFRHPQMPALADRVAAEGIRLTVRSGYVRVGLHYFNNEADVETLLRLLQSTNSAAPQP